MSGEWDSGLIHCSEPGCEKTIKAHKWGQIKSGWFQQKNGDNWCPDHYPEWYLSWKRAKEKK